MLQLTWTMFVNRIIDFSLLYALTAVAKPLQIVSENSLSPSVSNIVQDSLVSNISRASSTPDPLGSYVVRCNGDLYGYNPNIVDCERAAAAIIPDGEQLIWGERHTGLPQDIFPLPFAIFGGKL